MRFTVRRMMAIVALTAGTLWLFDNFGGVAICDSRYYLTVRVRSASETPIRMVWREAFGNETNAAESLEERLIAPGWVTSADTFIGQELMVSVPATAECSPLGRMLSYVQFRFLLVIVTYSNGRRIGKVVPIPHRDVTRTVSVEFP